MDTLPGKDKLKERERGMKKKEIKKGCAVVSVTWLITLAFMAQFCITSAVLADMYSLFLLLLAVMQIIGR